MTDAPPAPPRLLAAIGGTPHDWWNTGFTAILAGLFAWACARNLGLL